MSKRENPESNMEALLASAYEVNEAQRRLRDEERTYREEVGDKARYIVRPLPGKDDLWAVRAFVDNSEESYEELSGKVIRTREWTAGTRKVTADTPFEAHYFGVQESTGGEYENKVQLKFEGLSRTGTNNPDVEWTWELTIGAGQLSDVEVVEVVDGEEISKWVGSEALAGAAISTEA